MTVVEALSSHLAAACPVCKAETGEPCVADDGRNLGVVFHLVRVNSALYPMTALVRIGRGEHRREEKP